MTIICCVQECRLLLLSLTLVSLLPATPELAIRTTVSLSPEHSVGSITFLDTSCMNHLACCRCAS